ncbi:unnamed protein product [Rhizoctonia solani]|uniref:GmrSD restriction endonucleases C-terminal domain-containing protein n=1 Tax=Rhizoctonia solani TaxID=456999 RepID=A0A8H3GQP2_9AGAM|nr:unnamed protein product [Rhizoctonia solani]
MRFTFFFALVTLASASPLSRNDTRFIGRRGNLPEPVNAVIAKQYLAELPIALPVVNPPYDRTKFPRWITIDGECDTRKTVLKRDALAQVIVDSQCNPTFSSWRSDYDGVLITDRNPVGLDISHLVSLKEAWQSGAWNWTQERRTEFANDLTRPQLLPVTAMSNRMKGDKDPAKWMPSNRGFRCLYVRAWIQIKHYYGLAVDEAEKNKLTTLIRNC